MAGKLEEALGDILLNQKVSTYQKGFDEALQLWPLQLRLILVII